LKSAQKNEKKHKKIVHHEQIKALS